MDLFLMKLIKHTQKISLLFYQFDINKIFLKYFQIPMQDDIFFGNTLDYEQPFGQQDLYSYEEYSNQITQASIPKPYEFCSTLKQSTGPQKKIMDIKTGTTTLAFVFKHGVLIAVDSRATMGNFISSQTVKKVITISNRKLATIAGGAADCQFWQAWLAQQVRTFQLKHGKQPSVAAASRMMVNIINYYKQYGLQMGLMLAGVDENGPNLYYINTEGSRIKGDKFSVGSGMTYAYGVMDTFYRFDMSVEQAVELGRRSIYHATNRDTASGGYVRVFHVHQNGWTQKIAGDDVNVLHYQYRAEKGFEEDKQRGKL